MGTDHQRTDHQRKVAAVASTSTAAETLYTPSEVASLFRVDPKTVTRWAKQGRLTPIRTLGGHRRYRASEVEQLLKPGSTRGE
ncbi:MAG: BldC family transcriptional regulator [Gemmatimonadota bacterium]